MKQRVPICVCQTFICYQIWFDPEIWDKRKPVKPNFFVIILVNTHMHADHITGTGVLKKLSGCKSIISSASGAKADILVGEKDTISFGDHRLRILSTPGHTNGCVTYYIPEQVCIWGKFGKHRVPEDIWLILKEVKLHSVLLICETSHRDTEQWSSTLQEQERFLCK